ncbi:ATP-binding protein [Pararhodospirillum photometricum]|uniref:histidine kinase n=1 Tax=Pararhodospirillum photometricum DSM 122 TaxID=1150469 RepID=H6SMJ7_PARPM|nr:ATP-binding protein [Pararhodospirillum photometricum]CCG09132.1 Sensor protein [Pararhodospirillum photometricum DSM 122]
MWSLRKTPWHRSLRFKLITAALSVEMLMLALLLGNSYRVLSDATEERVRSRLEALGPMFDAAFSSRVFTRDKAELQAIVQTLTEGQRSDLPYILVYTLDGRLLAHAGTVEPSAVPLNASVASLTAAPVLSVERDLLLQGTRVGRVHFGLSVQSFLLSRDHLVMQSALIAVLEVVLSFVILALTSYLITRPLHPLVAASQKLTHGDYGVRLTFKTQDEMGQLADAFNGMAAAIEDKIATLKRTEDLLRTSQTALLGERRFLKTLLATIPQMIWLKNADGVYLACNREFELFFGASEEEIVGQTDHDFLDQNLADFFRERDLAAIEAGRPMVNEEWITYAVGGARVLLQTTKTPMIDEDGTLIGVLGIAYEITALRQNEIALQNSRESLKQAQKVAQIGSWDLDIPSGRLTWSEQTYRIFGLPPERPMDLETFFACLPRDDQAQVMTAWHAALDGTPYDIEHRILHQGTIRWVRQRAEVRFGPDGQPLKGTGTAQDVTDRKRAELKMMDSVEELTRSNAELERFAYIASHDLQEPLRSIVSFTQLIERRMGNDFPAEHRENFAFVVEAAKRMSLLIQDLLAVSRVASPGTGFTRVALADACTAALDNLRDGITQNHAEIVVKSLPEINGDSLQLMQVFQNLIGNALKFRHPGRRPKIVVRSQRKDQMWEISVTDNGIGIGPTSQDVFEMFCRLHPKTAYPGTGIGLTICKRIVARHGGTITMTSDDGQGTTFTFTLPVVP